jgi:tetratricopeptide (TPR) repeat protein
LDSRQLSSELLAIAEGQHDTAALLNAHFAVGGVLLFLWEFLAARTHLEHVSSLCDPSQHQLVVRYGGHDAGVHSLCYQTLALWNLGYPDQAANRIQAALSLAQELSHPYSLGLAFGLGVIGYLLRREVLPAQDFIDAAIRLSVEQGFGYLPIWITVHGELLVELNRIEEGIARQREGLASMRATGLELARTHYLSYLADAYGKAGRPEEGLAVIAEALDAADQAGERFYESVLYRVRGDLLLKLGVQEPESKVEEQAEACFRQAIDVARHRSAKSFEMRATMSLARLIARQGRRDEARAMLAEI